MLAREVQPGLHQHADRSRCGVPDVHTLLGQQAVPAPRVELLGVDDRGHAADQGCDDAVGEPGDPARVCRAPHAVGFAQVQRLARRRVLRHHRVVRQHHALGLPRGAAGEVQQRGAVGGGAGDLARCRAGRQRVGPGQGSGRRRLARRGDDDHVLQGRQRGAQRRDLARVECRGGDQHPRGADRQAGLDRLRSERGEERAEHAPRAQRAERRDVKLGAAPEQAEHASVARRVQRVEPCGEAARTVPEVRVAEVVTAPVAIDEARGDPAAAARLDVAIDRDPGDVERPARVQCGARGAPREVPTLVVVVGQVGRSGFGRRLAQHREPRIRAGHGSPREDVRRSGPSAEASARPEPAGIRTRRGPRREFR